jgi:hypothetical protein
MIDLLNRIGFRQIAFGGEGGGGGGAGRNMVTAPKKDWFRNSLTFWHTSLLLKLPF